VTPNQRGMLMWLGGAGALGVLALALFWNDLSPSSSAPPSASLPVGHGDSSPSGATRPATSTASPTPTVTPTVTPTEDGGRPSRPEEARGLTVAAAAAFARAYFTEAINHAKVTGDGSVIRAWSDLSCTLCRKNAAVFTASNQANGLLTGDHRWRDAHVSHVEFTDANTATVDLSMSIGRHTFRPNRSVAPAAFPARTVYLRLTLVPAGDDWVMFDWEGLQ
jgi:hypothetical protein